MRRRTCLKSLIVVPASSLALAACGSAGTQPSGSGSSADGSSPRTIILASPRDPGKYNPLTGEAQYGVSLLYDGLLAMESSGDSTPPELVPALAAEMPTVSSDGATWTVKVRQDVLFSDGSKLTAADVAATYSAILDPGSASTIASNYSMLESVEAAGDTVSFKLRFPYAEFGSRLLLGIAPAAKLTGGPAAELSLNSEPVGTGAYTLTELTADRAVFTARDDHFRGRPVVDEVRTVLIADDNVRAQRMAAGEIDGTILPPALAMSLQGTPGVKVLPVHSVDFRTISLPSTVAFTSDPAARMAMNLAVDRQAMVDAVLAGQGTPAYTPIPPELGEAYASDATFAYDVAKAKALLDEAGWKLGADGVREKNGEKAIFPLVYAASDTLRRDLAVAFAADMEKIGVRAELEGSTWDKIEPRLGSIGLVLGGGSHPTSPDALAYEALHRRTAATSSPYSNPGNFGSDALDEALETARRTLDETERAKRHQDAQRAYVADPGGVFLVFLRHVYVAKETALPPEGTALVLQPHLHDSGWGPWWNLATWPRP